MAKKKSGSNKFILLVIVILLVLGGILAWSRMNVTKSVPSVIEPTAEVQPYSDEISVTTPKRNEKVASPLLITGKAKGNWYFEGVLGAELFDQNNISLGVTQLTAKGNWMSEDFVDFEGKIEFQVPPTGKGVLKLKNDNPSGLPENDKSIEIPVTF